MAKYLPEGEEIKKRWQEYTEELHKKVVNYSDNHNGVITHLEPDTLEYEVQWALGSIIPGDKDVYGQRFLPALLRRA